MRVLIFGATGLLGKALVQEWHMDDKLIGVGTFESLYRASALVWEKQRKAVTKGVLVAGASR